MNEITFAISYAKLQLTKKEREGSYICDVNQYSILVVEIIYGVP